jgi:hypothetical protein
MCDPLTIAGIALTAGSTVANSMAASKVAKARDNAMAAERMRQNTLNQEADALNVVSQDRYQNFDEQQSQEATKLGDYFAGQTTAEPTAAEALPTTTSNITVQEEDKQRDKARDFTDKTGAALGNLRSFGDLLGSIGRSQARDAGQIGQIGGFKAGSSNVLPFELDEASQKGNGLKLFGDILGGLGSVATGAGLSGGGIFGIGAKSAAPAVSGAARAVTPAAGASGTLRLSSLYGGR